MYYDKKLWDMVEQAALYSKESDGSFTKVCDVKDISHVNPTYIPDRDDSTAYADYIFKQQEAYSFKARINDIDKYLADLCSKTVYSYKVVCTTRQHQNRCHHKYRINKKWAKRYGYTYTEVQNEPIIFMNDTIYCTKDGLDQIKKMCK